MKTPAIDSSLLILVSLANGVKHGWAIVSDVKNFAGLHLPQATLYAALARLESQDMILRMPGEGKRRPYAITAAGRKTLWSEMTLMRQLTNVGGNRLQSD